MFRENHLKKTIANGEPTIGVWLSIPAPTIAEIMSHVGYDFMIIDNEHGQMTLESSTDMMRGAMVGHTTTMIRVPGQDPDYMKRVLDAGAEALMIPMVETAEQARAIVAACRYPPRGVRGYAAPAVRGSSYGKIEDYIDRAHEQLFITVQVETLKGTENAGEIAAVEGVDMVFIGPGDLSGAAGHLAQSNHTEVLALIRQVERDVKAAGKPLGTIPRAGVSPAQVIGEGYLFVAGSVDTMMLRAAAQADIDAFRAGLTKNG